MLEAAAKAAGIRLEWDGNPDDWAPMYYEGKTYHGWEPLEDDGDALRLAVKLRFMVSIDASNVGREIHVHSANHEFPMIREPMGSDSYAATRRAILRAAAALATQKD